MGTMVLQSVEYLMSKDCKRGQEVAVESRVVEGVDSGKEVDEETGSQGMSSKPILRSPGSSSHFPL